MAAGVLIGARFGRARAMPEMELLGALADTAELVDRRDALERPGVERGRILTTDRGATVAGHR
jgi:hypothetical protein